MLPSFAVLCSLFRAAVQCCAQAQLVLCCCIAVLGALYSTVIIVLRGERALCSIVNFVL